MKVDKKYKRKGIYKLKKDGLRYYKTKKGLYVEETISNFLRKRPLMLFSLVLSGISLMLSFFHLVLSL